MARLALTLVLLAGTCAPAAAQVQLEAPFPALSFLRPTAIEHAPGQPGRLYVAEQAGRIRTFVRTPEPAAATDFLDLRGVVDASANEAGLLGLAFHPRHAENGLFYVNYTAGNPLRTRISQFSRSAGEPAAADPASEVVLLEVPQPFSNHNGGDLAFGPDGYLYVALGDGGSAGDPLNHGQRAGTLLGAVLRLDVDGGGAPPDCGGPEARYTVPPNALADGPGGACDEVYAYGLRNPWRLSFDAETGELWVADVGQGAFEEVNVVADGDNLGWKVKEGPACFSAVAGNPPCDDPTLVDPVWWYGHGEGDRSVTGGFVYRGSAVPELEGRYVFGDFISGRIWALQASGTGPAELLARISTVSTFGVDEEGELYVGSFDGRLRRFASAATPAEVAPPGGADRLWLAGPNPSRGGTAVRFTLARSGVARVALYDVLGRRVGVAFEGAVAAGAPVTVPLAEVGPPGAYVVRLEREGGAGATLRVTLLP